MPTPKTARQDIIDDLIDRFGDMTTTTGYSTQYKLVADWRLASIDVSDLPAIVLEDREESVVTIADAIAQMKLKLDVYIVVKASTAPADLRKYIADIFKCIGEDPTCSGTCDEVIPVDNEIILDLEDGVHGVIRTTWFVMYETGAWDLYNNLS